MYENRRVAAVYILNLHLIHLLLYLFGGYSFLMPIIVCGGVSAGRGFFIFFRVCVCVCDIRQQKQQEQNKRRLLFLYSFLFAVLVIIFNAAINRSFLSLLYSTAAI